MYPLEKQLPTPGAKCNPYKNNCPLLVQRVPSRETTAHSWCNTYPLEKQLPTPGATCTYTNRASFGEKETPNWSSSTWQRLKPTITTNLRSF
jgi:hypothetical protein